MSNRESERDEVLFLFTSALRFISCHYAIIILMQITGMNHFNPTLSLCLCSAFHFLKHGKTMESSTFNNSVLIYDTLFMHSWPCRVLNQDELADSLSVQWRLFILCGDGLKINTGAFTCWLFRFEINVWHCWRNTFQNKR